MSQLNTHLLLAIFPITPTDLGRYIWARSQEKRSQYQTYTRARTTLCLNLFSTPQVTYTHACRSQALSVTPQVTYTHACRPQAPFVTPQVTYTHACRPHTFSVTPQVTYTHARTTLRSLHTHTHTHNLFSTLQVTTADFGEVLVGKSAERVLRFGNHSMVPANFTVVPENQEQAVDSVYTVLPARWGSKSVRHFVSLYKHFVSARNHRAGHR
jgi:hypothetical protein